MTEQSMVEKVARAIALRYASEGGDSNWERLPEPVKDDCRRAARAAIEALREPTKAMMRKSAYEQASVSGTNYESMGPCNDTDDVETAEKAWKAAISVALK